MACEHKWVREQVMALRRQPARTSVGGPSSKLSWGRRQLKACLVKGNVTSKSRVRCMSSLLQECWLVLVTVARAL